MKDFYVYIYLDPRKSGHYIFGDICFLYEPFYVGKGHKNRNLDHLRYIKHYNHFMQAKISKIQQNHQQPLILQYAENISEESAFLLEQKLIENIGRTNLQKGPLTNLTDGGEGVSGYVYSREQKLKFSESGKRAWQKPEIREKFIKAQQKRWLKEEEIEKARRRAIKQFSNPQNREKCSKATSKAIKECWQDPKFRQKVLGTIQSECFRKKASEKTLNQWKDPEKRQKLLQAKQNKESREKTSKTIKGTWNDPEIRRKRIEGLQRRAPWHRLKNEEVWLIKKLLFSKKFTNKFIAKIFKVNAETIRGIHNEKIWVHVKFEEV